MPGSVRSIPEHPGIYSHLQRGPQGRAQGGGGSEGSCPPPWATDLKKHIFFLWRKTAHAAGPDTVVKSVCLNSRRSWVRTPLWHSSWSLGKIQYCGFDNDIELIMLKLCNMTHRAYFSHSVQWFSLWDAYRYRPISHSSCILNWNVRQLCHVWRHRVRKYKRCSFFVWYGKIQHMFHEKSVRLKAHTLFIERVLYFPHIQISHSNEHRLHVICVTSI